MEYYKELKKEDLPKKKEIVVAAENVENQDEHKSIYDGPIDLVYTWVNGSDPNFIKSIKSKKKKQKKKIFFNKKKKKNN